MHHLLHEKEKSGEIGGGGGGGLALKFCAYFVYCLIRISVIFNLLCSDLASQRWQSSFVLDFI